MLKTARYLIRVPESADLETLHTLLQEEDLPFWPASMRSLQDFRQHFESLKLRRFLICEQGQIVGLINAFPAALYSDALELGYRVLRPECKRQGMMNEALPAVMDYFFRTERCVRLQVIIVCNNLPSLNLAEKIGFKKEGLLRQYFMQGGEDQDAYILSYLRSDWQAAKN